MVSIRKTSTKCTEDAKPARTSPEASWGWSRGSQETTGRPCRETAGESPHVKATEPRRQLQGLLSNLIAKHACLGDPPPLSLSPQTGIDVV